MDKTVRFFSLLKFHALILLALLGTTGFVNGQERDISPPPRLPREISADEIRGNSPLKPAGEEKIRLTGAVGEPAPSSAPPNSPRNVPALGAPTTTQPATTPAPVGANSPALWNLEFAQAKRTQIEAEKEIDPETKKKIIEALAQVVAQIQTNEDWRKKLDDYELTIKSAPAQTAQLKADVEKNVANSKVEIPTDKTLAEMEKSLAEYSAKISQVRKQTEELANEPKVRAARRQEFPKLTAGANQRLQEAVKRLEGKPDASAHPEINAARKALALLRKKGIELELEVYEKEGRAYDASAELLALRRSAAQKSLAAQERAMKAWQAAVDDRRRKESEDQANEARKVAMGALPAVAKIANRNAELADLRAQLAKKIKAASSLLDEFSAKPKSIRDDLKTVQAKVKAAGLTHTIGLLLRKQRSNLPDISDIEQRLAARQAEISQLELQRIDLDEQRDQLADVESAIEITVEEICDTDDEAQRASATMMVTELLQRQKEYLQAVLSDFDTYFNKLVDLDAKERELKTAVTTYSQYVDENILWIRSAPAFGMEPFRHVRESLGRLVTHDDMGSVIIAIASKDPRQFSSAVTLTVVFIAIAILLYRQRIRLNLRALGTLASSNQTTDFAPTAQAMLLTLILAGLAPAVIWLIGWRLDASLASSDLVKAIASGCMATSFAYFTTNFARFMFFERGLGEAHFCWPAITVRLLRKSITRLMVVGLPLVFLVRVFDVQPSESLRDSVGRFVFLIGQLTLLGFVAHVLHPRQGVLANVGDSQSTLQAKRYRYPLYLLALFVPVGLATLACLGYYYTAVLLARRVLATVWLVLGAVLAFAMTSRWLLLTERRLAQGRAEQKRNALLAEPGSDASRVVPTSMRPVAIMSADSQAKRLANAVITVTLLAGIWAVWVDVLPALRILDRVELWTQTVTNSETVTASDGSVRSQSIEEVVPVTLANLIVALAVLFLTIVASRNIPGLLEITVLQRLPLDAGGRYAFTTICRYAITIVGLVASFFAIRFTWSNIQWLVAAVTVGLGFGLQEIFANFISGLILLFERPIRIGDTVTVGDVHGIVSRIRIRATTITDWDRKELIVPNKEFITSKFVNWTLTDRVLRVVIKLSIAINSDVRLARDVLLKVVLNHPKVLTEPPPSAVFEAFGDSTYDFSVRVFVGDLSDTSAVRNELNLSIAEALRSAGIEIASAGHDIRIVSDGATVASAHRAA